MSLVFAAKPNEDLYNYQLQQTLLGIILLKEAAMSVFFMQMGKCAVFFASLYSGTLLVRV